MLQQDTPVSMHSQQAMASSASVLRCAVSTGEQGGPWEKAAGLRGQEGSGVAGTPLRCQPKICGLPSGACPRVCNLGAGQAPQTAVRWPDRPAAHTAIMEGGSN